MNELKSAKWGALLLFKSWSELIAHAGALAMGIYCLVLPPPDDVIVVFSWAQLVEMGHSLGAVFDTWLMRGFGYKALSFGLYITAEWLSGSSAANGVFFAAYNLCILATVALVSAIETM